MSDAPRHDAPLRSLVVAVSVLAVAGAAVFLAVGSLTVHVPLALWLLAGVAALSVALPLRFHHPSGDVQGYNLINAVILAMLFVASAPVIVGVTMGVCALAFGLFSGDGRKTAFNTAQHGLVAMAAAVAFHAVGPGEGVFSLASVTAVLAASLAAGIVTSVLIVELFHRFEGRPRLEVFGESRQILVIAFVGNSIFGLLLAFLAVEAPAAIVLGALLLIAQFIGYRGYAGLLEERQRVERLHEVTKTLVAIAATADRDRELLDQLVALLSAQSAELVLDIEDAMPALMSAGHRSSGVIGPDDASQIALQAMRERRGIINAGGGDLPAALAAPIIDGGRVLGAVAVHGRRGMEEWREADVTLLSSVANEIAMALRAVELLSEVEQERARAEAESAKLANIIGTASDGIVHIDRDGIIRTWNRAATTITGVDRDDAIGSRWYTVLRLRSPQGNDLLPEAAGIVGDALEGERHSDPVDLQALRRDGSWRWLQCTFAPVLREDGDPNGTVMMVRDVTAEHEVSQLKSDFMATVSHELRTPLTPLKGFLETIRRRRDELEPEAIEQIHTSMSAQVSRLERLVGDLLAVAELDAGGVEVAKHVFDVAAVASAVVEETDSDRVRIEETATRVRARGDTKAAHRVIAALVDNGMKHTESHVVVRVAREGRDSVVVEVVDDGPGIAPWDHDKVFERFGRLGDHLTRTQGPGLGLPIARALAEQMGGELTLESDVDEGACFRLRLPAPEPSSHLKVVREDTEERTG